MILHVGTDVMRRGRRDGVRGTVVARVGEEVVVRWEVSRRPVRECPGELVVIGRFGFKRAAHAGRSAWNPI